MKSILILADDAFMLWQFRREVIGAILDQGHSVTIGVPFGDHIDDLNELGCRTIHTPMDRRGIRPVADRKLFRQYKQLLKDTAPDLVLTYSGKPNIYAGFLCRRMGIPCCVNVQGLGTVFQKVGISGLVTLMYKTALKKAKVVFFENQASAALFRELGITPERQQLVLSGAGINLEHYPLQPYPGNDRVHFLYSGRLMKEKGINELFSAIRRLHADGEELLLDIVGSCEEDYQAQVEEMEKQDICKFHGFQMDPRPYYAAADCVVLPSYHEGMSNVLLEAAATGRPIITSDIPGCREAVEPAVTGFTCPAQDSDALYETMQNFLTLTRSQREAMGLAGHKLMEQQFDKKNVVSETITAIFKEN